MAVPAAPVARRTSGAAILAATAPAVANPYLNATTGTAADTGGGVAVQPFVPAVILAATALAAANRRLSQVGVRLHSECTGTLCHVTALMQSSGRSTRSSSG